MARNLRVPSLIKRAGIGCTFEPICSRIVTITSPRALLTVSTLET